MMNGWTDVWKGQPEVIRDNRWQVLCLKCPNCHSLFWGFFEFCFCFCLCNNPHTSSDGMSFVIFF